MLKQTIKKWQAGIDAYHAGNLNEAQSCFKSIDDTSKILYCLGVVYFKQSNYNEAINTFGKSVRCDPFLAVSYFMQGAACQMKNDLGNAAAHYDEAMQALRGHEFIDYRQLGMDYKLLLCEILFNKALCMKSSGLPAVAQVMKQATSCRMVREEKTRYRFDDLCNAIANGDNSNAQPYFVPLDLMFQPPKIREKPSKTGEPPPARPTNALPPNPSPAPSPAPSAKPSLPPTPTPALSSATQLPAVPQKATGARKKLPPRPISVKLDAKIITLKCFYKDRRLIQITASYPDFDELRDKIAAKFVVQGLEIRYQNSAGETTPIRNLGDLQRAIDDNFTELYLGLPGETNEFEPQGSYSNPSSTSSSPSQNPPAQLSTTPPSLPPKSNGYKVAATQQPTGMSRAASTTGITTKPVALRGPTQNVTQPTTLSKSSSQPIKAQPTMPAATYTAASSPTYSSPTNGNSAFAANKAAVAAAVTTNNSAATKPKKQKSVWEECYTDEGERYFFNTETQETSWDPDIDPTPPWMVCHTDSGDKYYYNPDTDASTWDFPG
eukprot:Phypoly_transcript_06076.p1 GENE.Phypoly_transcript_06076~~Phypoly_transcript_06076.p1  ORF type:complete len:550 (+),score=128.65 Phypoly_transcript_06076:177-1826(+)